MPKPSYSLNHRYIHYSKLCMIMIGDQDLPCFFLWGTWPVAIPVSRVTSFLPVVTWVDDEEMFLASSKDKTP